MHWWVRYLFCAIEYDKFRNNAENLKNEEKLNKDYQCWYEELMETLNSFPNEKVEILDTKEASLIKYTNGIPIEISSIKEEKKDLTKDLQDKARFDSFEILDEVGAGAFGRIFKVKKKSNDQIYAMKALSKKHLVKMNQFKYAKSECKVLKLINHPFLIKMHFAFQTLQHLFMILDFCPGGDLAMYIENQHYFTESEIRFYISEIILAIEYLHSKNIIYRDMKPDNILIAEDGHIKLTDFGLAKEIPSSYPRKSSFCGSPAYLTPEMINKENVGKTADIYGIGAVMYELFAGFPPFYDSNLKTMYSNITLGTLEFPKHIPSKAVKLLKKMLERKPEKRISLEEIKKDPFFNGINWEDVAQKKLTPPIDIKEIELRDSFELFSSIQKGFSQPFVDGGEIEDDLSPTKATNFSFIGNQKLRIKTVLQNFWNLS